MINSGNDSTELWYRLNRLRNVTFKKTDWVGATAPYTQTVNVDGVTELDIFTPFFVDDSTSAAQSDEKKTACGCVSYYDSKDGKIMATCLYEKPMESFTVCMKG